VFPGIGGAVIAGATILDNMIGDEVTEMASNLFSDVTEWAGDIFDDSENQKMSSKNPNMSSKNPDISTKKPKISNKKPKISNSQLKDLPNINHKNIDNVKRSIKMWTRDKILDELLPWLK